MRPLLLCSLLFLFLLGANAQSSGRTKVFLDCAAAWSCDFDYVRSNVKAVDFVRDRFLSDIHISVITQGTDAGGEQQTVAFLGRNGYNGLTDTLRFFTEPIATNDEKRVLLVQYIKLGLVRYLARSSTTASKIEVGFDNLPTDTSSSAGSQKRDPWKLWIFSVGASGFFEGDQNYKQTTLNSSVSAIRETERSRIYFEVGFRRRQNKFSLSPTEDITVRLDREYLDFFTAKKLTRHWAVGPAVEYLMDEFRNIDHRLLVRPRVEYSITPYDKFNTERLVVQYSVGPEWSNYEDTTIRLKSSELLYRQGIRIMSSFNKPWGTINVGAFAQSYLHNIKRYNTSLSGSISWRIFKGFQFGVGGEYNILRDQIFLPKANPQRDQILTRSRAIASRYEYFFGIGFSYRFGSIYNSQVHPSFRNHDWDIDF